MEDNVDPLDVDDIMDFVLNKLNAKNSFDVKTDFIGKIPQMIEDGKLGEELWAKTSESIAAGSRIYSFRVDHISNKCSHIVNGLHRTNIEDDFDGDEEDKENQQPNHQK